MCLQPHVENSEIPITCVKPPIKSTYLRAFLGFLGERALHVLRLSYSHRLESTPCHINMCVPWLWSPLLHQDLIPSGWRATIKITAALSSRCRKKKVQHLSSSAQKLGSYTFKMRWPHDDMLTTQQRRSWCYSRNKKYCSTQGSVKSHLPFYSFHYAVNPLQLHLWSADAL